MARLNGAEPACLLLGLSCFILIETAQPRRLFAKKEAKSLVLFNRSTDTTVVVWTFGRISPSEICTYICSMHYLWQVEGRHYTLFHSLGVFRITLLDFVPDIRQCSSHLSGPPPGGGRFPRRHRMAESRESLAKVTAMGKPKRRVEMVPS